MMAEESPQLKSPLMGETGKAAEDGLATVDATDSVVISMPNSSSKPDFKDNAKLRYMDFFPGSQLRVNVHGGTRSKNEDFQTLVDHANVWLKKNLDVHVVTCETVTWMSTKKENLNDTEQMVLSKSIAENGVTYYKRGLRLWLLPRDPTHVKQPRSIQVYDFVPDANNDSIPNLVKKANKKLTGVEGKVICMETVDVAVINGNVDAKITSWTEKAQDDSPYAFILRVFLKRETVISETIGTKDFIPNPTEDGYEAFSVLIEKANTWLRDQSDIRVTNMQSIMVQKDNGPHSETGSACFFKMPGLHNEEPVEFFRIMRLFYTRPSDEAITELPVIYPFTFESFTPEVTVTERKKRERMEKMKETFIRIVDYLKATDYEIICAETVPNPMQIITERQGEETEQIMTWLLTPRLYLRGHSPGSPNGGAKLGAGGGNRRQASVRRDRNQRDGQKVLTDEPEEENGANHPGPIFLRNVVTGKRPYKMLVAFISVFVAITIIVVLSVVYSNQ